VVFKFSGSAQVLNVKFAVFPNFVVRGVNVVGLKPINLNGNFRRKTGLFSGGQVGGT